MVKESLSDGRLNMRLPHNTLYDIEAACKREGVSKKDYVLKALDFYEEHRHFYRHGYSDIGRIVQSVNKRNMQVDQWCQKLNLSPFDFYLDAINFYLDAMTLSNGQPDTMSLLTLNTLMRTVSAQLDSVETKTDTLTNIAIDGFSSFARISSGASYLIDNVDDGKLPETKIQMTR